MLVRQRHIVLGWQLPFFVKFLIHTLADGTICAISADKYVTLICAVVGRANHNAVGSLRDGHDPLAEMQSASRNPTEEHIVE